MDKTAAEWEELAEYFDAKAQAEVDAILRGVYEQSAKGCRYVAKDAPLARRGDKELCDQARAQWMSKYTDEKVEPSTRIRWESDTNGRISYTVDGMEVGYAAVRVGRGSTELSGPCRHAEPEDDSVVSHERSRHGR